MKDDLLFLKLWKPFISNLVCWRIKILRTRVNFPVFPVCSIWRRNLINWRAAVFSQILTKNNVLDNNLIWYERRFAAFKTVKTSYLQLGLLKNQNSVNKGQFSRFSRMFDLTSKFDKLTCCCFFSNSDQK